MRVQELAPGLWRWTGEHPAWVEGADWEQEVGSVYYEAPDAVVLIDPLVPPEAEDRFWAALDRDVKRAVRPLHILLTTMWHGRSAESIVERYGGEIWAPEESLALDRDTTPTRTFQPGDRLPGDVVAYEAVRQESVFWIPPHSTLVFPDVLVGDAAGGVRLCPESWLAEGDRGDHARLEAALRPLLDLPVERLLLSHGEPVLAGAREALARALD
jgi:glyoxylase-like metal-dependent hydrolase (beta-lactamase superfamily II)